MLNKFEKKSCHQQWTHWSESNSIILQIYSKLSNWATMIYIRFSTVKFLYKKGVIKISGGLRFSKIKIGTCRIRCGILPRLVRFESHICCRIIEYIHKKNWTLSLFLSITLFNCTSSLTHMISRLSTKKNWIIWRKRSSGFLRIFTEAFFLFLTPAGGSNSAGLFS